MSKVAIIGSGVVGQASGKGLIAKGHQVIFADVNLKTLLQLSQKGFEAVEMDNLAEKIEDIEIFFLSVSTPTENGKINLDYIKAATASLGKAMAKKTNYSVVVFRSTLPPGTSRNVLTPIIEENSGLKAGKNFGVCMNPEYLREAKAEEDFLKPKAITIGALGDRSFDRLNRMYSPFEAPVYRMSLEEAEMQKYIHNIFNATKIAFFNEMRQVAEELGIETEKMFSLVVKTAEASWNPEYGTKNFGPFNGMCLPKDTAAFKAWARENLDLDMLILGSVIDSNNNMIERKKNKETNQN